MCPYFRENWLLELPILLPLFSKRFLTFCFARDCNGNRSFPYCRYGYSCRYRHIDCHSIYKPIKVEQLNLFDF